MKYASVVVSLPIDKEFFYRIPQPLEGEAAQGKRVWVPFGKRRLVGYIVDIRDKTDIENLRPIESVIDKEPIISKEMLSLTKWISEYYVSSWAEAIRSAVPGFLRNRKPAVRAKKIFKEERYKKDSALKPTPEQEKALHLIKASLDKPRSEVFLLHGVTSSGKTEVYMQAIAHALRLDKSSIVLVPEISLTPQTVERFKARFGGNVAVMHSALTQSRRFHEYERIRNGEARIVIGARSAVFSPVENLGLIVVDEEHETSYKQENAPRYHARETAIKRAELANAGVILGSATPSLESYYNAALHRYTLLELTKRMKDADLPKVNIIDMRKELYERHYPTVFSRPLKESIEKVMRRKEQAILFLNRRGFSTFVNCKRCGRVEKCKRCDSVLVYHYSKKRLICHYCNWSTEPPSVCPSCSGSYLKYFGMGTERVESELHRHFPEGRIGRMDTDTTKKRGSHDNILGRFKNHDINLLIGTQMIAKGLDFPKVTLVGVISADTTLNIPDFRSSERTFNLLTQVAGRAGRTAEGGRVIIQTYTPEHYAITAASQHDYHAFYKKEIPTRKELDLPPFVNIIRIIFRSANEQRILKAAERFAKALEGIEGLEVLGPAPAAIAKVKNQKRWNIILKTKDAAKTGALLKNILSNNKTKAVSITVDVDPVSLL